MEKRRTGGGLLAATGIVAPWVASMMGLTLSAPVGWAILALCFVAFVIGLFLIFTPRRKPKPTGARQSSTTFKIRGGGRLELEDVDSSADTFLDAEEIESFSLKRGNHSPGQRRAESRIKDN